MDVFVCMYYVLFHLLEGEDAVRITSKTKHQLAMQPYFCGCVAMCVALCVDVSSYLWAGEDVARITNIINGSMNPVERGADNTVLVATVHAPSGLV